MITVGLSQHEINLITKILEEHKAEYHVDAAGGSSDNVKASGKRGDTSFYQIEIPHDEYMKLPASAKSKLENLGIYPEMEEPDFSDTPAETYKPSDATKVRSNFKKVERFLMLAFVVMLAFGFLYRAMKF
jgi:hypothetical protein